MFRLLLRQEAGERLASVGRTKWSLNTGLSDEGGPYLSSRAPNSVDIANPELLLSRTTGLPPCRKSHLGNVRLTQQTVLRVVLK